MDFAGAHEEDDESLIMNTVSKYHGKKKAKKQESKLASIYDFEQDPNRALSQTEKEQE